MRWVLLCGAEEKRSRGAEIRRPCSSAPLLLRSSASGLLSGQDRVAELFAADRVDVRLAVELLERQTHTLYREGIGPQVRRHLEGGEALDGRDRGGVAGVHLQPREALDAALSDDVVLVDAVAGDGEAADQHRDA